MKTAAMFALTTALLLAPASEAANSGGEADGGLGTTRGVANAERRTFDLWKGWSNAEADRPRRPAGPVLSEPQPEPRFTEAFTCLDGQMNEVPAPANGWCESGIPQGGVVDCQTQLVPPTRHQLVYADGTVSRWERLDDGACGQVLPVLTVEDFRSLPIPPPVLMLQPDQDWVLVNIATIVMTDPAPVTMRTTLGGYGIDVEAVPRLFTYDFGDGHDLVTRSAGHPYPDHDTFHEYETPGTYAITLTTEWEGRYRVDGDPTWREVTGTASTSATSAPFEAQERTSRLVSGLCTDRPKPPDC